MLTIEENERLTQVGPGTPGGKLLRRYWFPVAGLNELTDDSPTRFVRLLGEDLVLFKDKSGNVGLLADHCSHRGASLCYGRVEERGIACAYHGWLYDTQGNCLETPAEPAGSLFHLTVKQRAYPVERLFGLYWAYLGPQPAPPIRKLDIMQYPVKEMSMEIEWNANWVQVLENNLDGSHIFILHQDTYALRREANGQRPRATSTTRGLIDDLASLEYREVPAGILRTMGITDGYVEEDLLIFPNMLRRMNMLSIKSPVDDHHTRKFAAVVDLSQGPRGWEPEPAAHYDMPPTDAKTPVGASYPEARFRLDKVPYQDMMAIETQGPVSPRHAWHAGTRDNGVAFFDGLILREIEKVERGVSPLGADVEFVDTNLKALDTVGVR
jgi:5,5'-dehydrodivanillate O-demethylase